MCFAACSLAYYWPRLVNSPVPLKMTNMGRLKIALFLVRPKGPWGIIRWWLHANQVLGTTAIKPKLMLHLYICILLHPSPLKSRQKASNKQASKHVTFPFWPPFLPNASDYTALSPS